MKMSRSLSSYLRWLPRVSATAATTQYGRHHVALSLLQQHKRVLSNPRIRIRYRAYRSRRCVTSQANCRTALEKNVNYEVEVTGDDHLTISQFAAKSRRTTLPYIWLRDNCRCIECVNQDTSQRNFDTFALPGNLSVQDCSQDADSLSIIWAPDGHRSHFPKHFLDFYINNDYRKIEEVDRIYHNGSRDLDDAPKVSYASLMGTEKAVGTLTNHLQQSGFVFVEGVPYGKADFTQQVLERIAFIRETHYGGFYDFIPDLAKADTAYTNIRLPAHTDTTYFSDPAGLQAFHLLSHTPPSGASQGVDEKEMSLGGRSLLVDGFRAASALRKEDPEAFEILTKVRLPWHASGNEGITISPDKRYPVLEIHPDTGELYRVRWNNDDRGVVPFGSGIDPALWYEAAGKWNEILRREDMEMWTQLEPGKVLIFDNWRMLHGREEFQGVRRMCGGYINRDDFLSRWRNTNFSRKDILSQVIG